MNKYKVEITETLQKTIEVEADNKEDAMHKVMKMYKNSEVILDDNDFVNLDFNNAHAPMVQTKKESPGETKFLGLFLLFNKLH